LVPYGVWQRFTSGLLGQSPASSETLAYLAAEGDIQGVEAILDSGSDISVPDLIGCSLVIASASSGTRKTEMMALLLRRGARVNRTCGGDTALHRAAELGDEAVVKLLLAAGADPTLRNSNGFRPSDLAWGAHHEEVALILDKARAN
jgi:ankyrin repeat protein